jgi:predicted HAD superfamily Cof-like phosphohydrolase
MTAPTLETHTMEDRVSAPPEPVSPAVPVGEFHRRFGLPARTVPVDELPAAEVELRRRLLAEEFQEYLDAADTGDLVSVADALADMVYVIYGTALHYGIDLDAIIAEVHRSNMTKTGHDGGKAVKGKGYQRPDIAAVLDAQRIARTAPILAPAEGGDR